MTNSPSPPIAERPKVIVHILAACPQPWRDIIVSLQARAQTAESRLSEVEGERDRLRKAIETIADFVAFRPLGNNGSHQRGYDLGFNKAGEQAAATARQALTVQDVARSSTGGDGGG